MTIFKAYDIRGTFPDQIDESLARRIGQAYAAFMGGKQAGEKCYVVGRDMRTMAPDISDAFIDGILDMGSRVIDIGLASTPMGYYAIGKLGTDGGVVVTASHNTKEYIGFKMCREEARPLSGDSGIRDIEKLVQDNPKGMPVAKQRGVRDQVDVKSDFIDHIVGFAQEIKPQTMVVDYANGMGAAEAPEIFAKIPGLKIVPLYEELDGTFPNHEANPLKESNLDDLRAKIAEVGAPMGISFDGDADRCAFVDSAGRTVHADLITVILARAMLKKHPGKGIIYDLRSSKVVPKEIEKLGGRPVRERVGHSFMKETMRREDCIGGGELSGHFYFAENYFTDCGVLACIEVLNRLSEEGRELKASADELRVYFGTGEVNFKVEDKAEKMAVIEKTFPDGEVDHLDGVTVTYPDWWVNVRPSNTEPYLRMCLEADTPEILAEKREQIVGLLGTPT